MPSKDASKKTAKGFAEILSAARAAGLTTPPPDTAKAHKGALYYLALNDPIMSAAMQSARESLSGFLALARHPGPTMERFAVKIALLGDGGPEFFWIYPFAYVGDRFIGQIGNTPLTLAGPKKGDTITFGKRDIVDWDVHGRRRYEGQLFRARHPEGSPAARSRRFQAPLWPRIRFLTAVTGFA